MKWLIGTTIALLALVGTYVLVQQPAKERYEEVREELAAGVMTPAPLNEEAIELLATIEAEWRPADDGPSHIEADALRTAGLPVDIKGLERLYCTAPPRFSYLHPARNRYWTMVMLAQAIMLPTSTDGLFHVGDDVAFIHTHEKMTTVYRATDAGLTTRSHAKPQ